VGSARIEKADGRGITTCKASFPLVVPFLWCVFWFILLYCLSFPNGRLQMIFITDLILMAKTCTAYLLAFGLPFVFFVLVISGHDPIQGQMPWDIQLAEIKHRQKVGTGQMVNMIYAPKSTKQIT